MYGLEFKIEVFKIIKELKQSGNCFSIRDILEQIKALYSEELDQNQEANLQSRIYNLITRLHELGYLSRLAKKEYKNIETHYYSQIKDIV